MTTPQQRRALVLTAAVAMVMGVLLRREALSMGFYGDDSVQLAMLRGEFPAERSAFDLFRFADPGLDQGRTSLSGFLPWWAQRDLKIALFRPLASALIALDHRLFQLDAVAFHAHSLLWLAALLGVATLVFFELLPRGPAALASLLFALAPCHCAPASWLANRCALVATTFGLLGFWVHVRYRQRGRTRYGTVLECAAFALAFAAGEYAWSVVAFVLAFELVPVGQASRAERLRFLLPVLGTAFGYLLLRFLLGYGAHGSGFYLDPLDAPGSFLTAMAQRLPALAADLVLGLPAQWWAGGIPFRIDMTRFRELQTIAGVAAMVLLLWAARFVSVERYGARRSLAWVWVGTVASLIPGAGALPEDRALLAASMGCSSILAAAVATALASARTSFQTKRAVRGAAASALVAAILIVHGVLASRRSHAQVAWYTAWARATEKWARDAEIPDSPGSDVRVVLLAGADFTTNALLPWARRLAGAGLVRSYVRLSGAAAPHELLRVSERALEVTVLSQFLDSTMTGSLYRSAANPFRVGDTADAGGMHTEVLAVTGSNPSRMRFTFDRPLEDASYVWLQATPRGLRRLPLPAVGERTFVPPPGTPLR